MNERLSLQDLIDLLAKKQEITKKDAEAFLRELIAVISENIENNEPVKIKDFGTFKLVKVSPRKSVDVNTGEAIEIAAHYKLSFIPDKSLKEAINRPFAHFESVVLEEGVTFDNIESEVEEERGEEAEEDAIVEDNTGYIAAGLPKADVEEKPEGVDTEPENAVQPVGIINAGISEEEAEEEFVGETVEPEPAKEKEKSGYAAAPVPEGIISKIEEEAALRNVNIEDILLVVRENNKKEKNLASKAAENEDEFEHEDGELVYEDTVPKRKGIHKRYIALVFFIFLIIAGFIIGGLYFQKIATYLTRGSSDSDNNTLVADTPVPETQAEVILMDTLAPKQDTAKTPQTPNPLLRDRGKDVAPLPPVKQAKATTPLPAVNGAIGVETIQYGHTLRNIALKYYGNKSFWVYIYEENKDKIKNINNVPIGTKLTIPAPVKYGIDPQNGESVRKARVMEEAMFKRADITGVAK